MRFNFFKNNIIWGGEKNNKSPPIEKKSLPLGKGTYRETLPFGRGDLVVTKNDYYISFYFPGPDRRYNGEFIHINKNEIDKYIRAFKNNWCKYLELKKIKSQFKEGNLSFEGELGMRISVNGYGEGVWTRDHNIHLEKEKDIQNMIKSLEWAKEKGTYVMRLLKDM